MYIEADEIVLKSSILSEIEELNKIYREATQYFLFDPKHDIVDPYICIKKGDLPPNGSKDNYEILSCFFNGDIVGYTCIYKGYPDPKTVYISFMFLIATIRHQGIGKRILEMMCHQFKENEFKNIRISVSLKNWGGLKFWHSCGFDKITRVDCLKAFTLVKYGCMELEKEIF